MDKRRRSAWPVVIALSVAAGLGASTAASAHNEEEALAPTIQTVEPPEGCTTLEALSDRFLLDAGLDDPRLPSSFTNQVNLTGLGCHYVHENFGKPRLSGIQLYYSVNGAAESEYGTILLIADDPAAKQSLTGLIGVMSDGPRPVGKDAVVSRHEMREVAMSERVRIGVPASHEKLADSLTEPSQATTSLTTIARSAG